MGHMGQWDASNIQQPVDNNKSWISTLSNYRSALSINNKMFTLLLNMIHQPPNGVIYITITTKKFLL